MTKEPEYEPHQPAGNVNPVPISNPDDFLAKHFHRYMRNALRGHNESGIPYERDERGGFVMDLRDRCDA